MGKTVWQWIALTMYFVGVMALIGAWITLHTWPWAWFMLTVVITWSIAIWCVIYRPVKGKG